MADTTEVRRTGRTCTCNLQEVIHKQDEIITRLENMEELLTELITQRRAIDCSNNEGITGSRSMTVARQVGAVLLQVLKYSNKDKISGMLLCDGCC